MVYEEHGQPFMRAITLIDSKICEASSFNLDASVYYEYAPCEEDLNTSIWSAEEDLGNLFQQSSHK